MAISLVVDASVVVKLFIDEDDSQLAESLLSRSFADHDSRLYAPDLLYAECANVLWKYVRRAGFSAEDARSAVTDLAELPLRIVSTRDLSVEAMGIALEIGASVYDSVYVALAARLRVPLVTMDEPLARRVSGSICQLVLLRDFED